MLSKWIRTDHKAVDKTAEVRQVLGWLRGETREPPVICDGSRPYGVPNRAAFMSSRVDDKAHVGRFTKSVPVLRSNTPVDEALDAYATAIEEYLPVANSDKLTGYIRAVDVLGMVERGPTAAESLHLVAQIHENETVGRAVQLFRGQASDFIPVLGEREQVVGALPRSTIVDIEQGRLVAQGKPIGDYSSGKDRMLDDAVSGFTQSSWSETGPDTPFADLLDILRQDGYVFVREPANSGKVLGVVTPSYLARAVRREHAPRGMAYPR